MARVALLVIECQLWHAMAYFPWEWSSRRLIRRIRNLLLHRLDACHSGKVGASWKAGVPDSNCTHWKPPITFWYFCCSSFRFDWRWRLWMRKPLVMPSPKTVYCSYAAFKCLWTSSEPISTPNVLCSTRFLQSEQLDILSPPCSSLRVQSRCLCSLLVNWSQTRAVRSDAGNSNDRAASWICH